MGFGVQQSRVEEAACVPPEVAGDGGPYLECVIKTVRWEPSGRWNQGQIMSPLPKQKNKKIKGVSNFASLLSSL